MASHYCTCAHDQLIEGRNDENGASLHVTTTRYKYDATGTHVAGGASSSTCFFVAFVFLKEKDFRACSFLIL